MNTSMKHKRPIEIKDRHSGRVLFETEVETLKDALEEAVALRVNLSCADLRNLDLRGACLANAELSNADFSGADLSNAILWKATLIGTRFCNVNLRHTNFRHAKLKKAVLKNSNLIGINFLGSDLTQADFRNSNLEGAELRDANLTHTYFDARLKAPEKGSFVGWKRIYDIQGNSAIAKLLIPEDAKRTTPLGGRYCRAEFVKVLELNSAVLFAKSKLYPTSIYYVGGIVRATYYESDVRAGYAYGIGFFLTREEAEQHYGPLCSVPAVEYWKTEAYRGWLAGAKCINQPDNKESQWRVGVLLDTSTAKLMNQWDKEEKLQERPNHQTSLVRCTSINSMGQTLGFYLNDVGHTVVPANSGYPPIIENHSQKYALSCEKGRVLQDFQVVYISEGKGVFQSTQGEPIPINAGDALLLYPGEWHRYQPDPEVGWTQFWINFNGDYADKLMSSEPLSSLRPIIRIGHDKELFQLLSNLAETMYSKPFLNPAVAAAQGIQVLAHLAITDQRHTNKYSDQVEAALCYIYEHAEQAIDYRTLARNLGFSSYTIFRQEFDKVTGLPHTQYQLGIRLDKAKELLCGTTLPIGEIADQLGFRDQYYFARFFKAKTGITASEYRQTSSGVSIRQVKELLCETTLPTKEIADQFGFRGPHHFARFFKAKTGMTPSEYRQKASGSSIRSGQQKRQERDWVDEAKCLNQPNNEQGGWQAEKLSDTSTAKLMNQWDKEEKSQEGLHHQISLAHGTPIDPMNRTLGFYLNDAGFAIVPANSVYSPTVENPLQKYVSSWRKRKVRQDFQMVYISKGKGIFQSTQSGLISINAGDALLLLPGEWDRYRPDPEVGWTEYWIRFNGDYASKLISELFPPSRRPILRIGHNEALLQLLITLTRTVRTHSNPLLTAAQGIQVLAHLIAPTQRPRGRYSEQIELALCHISEHAEQTIDFEAFVRKLGLSYSVFYRQFHEATKMSPTNYQQMIRLSKAKELLCETTLPIWKIAERVGFKCPYYFGRFFKAKIGMTPGEYRQASSERLIRDGMQKKQKTR
jgi:AraC-like DNA-binding protein/quercetin dioxygenase-like cupin family protein